MTEQQGLGVVAGFEPGPRLPPLLPVVGIAASTGGPQALRRVLSQLEGLQATVLIVQHIHRDFVAGLVDVLAVDCPLPVEIATDGQRLQPGRVLLAPSDRHLLLARGRRVLLQTEPVALHRPSATVLLQSIAHHAGSAGIGVLLTGMGDDGALGLLAMRNSGGMTIVQDEESCVVYGMPRAALACGAAMHSLPLDRIGAAIRRAVMAVSA